MLDLLKKELDSQHALSGDLPIIIDKICEAIPSQTVPQRMKQTIAVSEMILFASQFRRSIHHWDGTLVPINAISFVITGSGVGKDSSVNAVRKCFKTGYNLINDKRKHAAKKNAMDEARAAGEADFTSFEGYKDYYRAPNPLFAAPSTVEGFIQHLNDLEDEGIGAGYMYSGEIGAELAQNALMSENIKILSELYDLGNKEVKMIKARENQSKEIKGLPVSSLFVGSPANILYDEGIKKRFTVEFSSKLARRSFFAFCPEVLEEPQYETISEMLMAEEQREEESYQVREKIAGGVATLATSNLEKIGKPFEVDDEVRHLFTIYKRYNSEVAEEIPNLFPMSKLVRRHLQWKAFKLAGAIAMFNQHETITGEDYKQAMRFCELLDKDLMAFEAELVKEPYEVFADYAQAIATHGESEISLHNLRKMKYIPMNGDSTKKMKELCHLANAYDKDGIYTVHETSISYKKIVKLDKINISFKPINTSSIVAAVEAGADKKEIEKQKGLVATTAQYGLETAETTFEELGTMLTKDYAYSPYKFKNGHRMKENLIGGTKWLVLDVDKSDVTADECHFMLQDINHHIALSSDATNRFKYRILIELDSEVETDAITWQHFYMAIANDFSLTVDPLPQSQLFFSYEGREVMSTLDAEPLAIKDYFVKAQEYSLEKPAQSQKKLTSPQKQALLDDELTTFAQAFEAEQGEGSRKLIWAAKYAYNDLDLPKDQVEALIHRINDYWLFSMDDERLEKTILSQIRRW